MSLRQRPLLWHLYPGQVLILFIALLAFTWYGTTSIRSFYLERTSNDLEARAFLLANSVLHFLETKNFAALQPLCQDAGQKTATRFTIVAPDGKVLADSNEDPARMENHNDRPEIISARAGKSILSVRFSQTLQANLAYMAIVLPENEQRQKDKPDIVIRAAVPLTALDKALSALSRQFVFAFAIVGILAALLTWLVARRVSSPLEQMEKQAEHFAQGDFSEKMVEGGVAELASLARTLNKMAGQLDDRIQIISDQHSQLRAVFTSMVEGVITVDTKERILDINQSGARLLNVEPEKIKGKSILLAIRNTHLQFFVKNALACAAPVEGEFSSRMGADGKEKYFYAHGTRLQNNQGQTTGVLIVINDVTKLRRLESIRQDFVANVSHELKTPITSIEGFAETLLDGALDDPEDARRFVEIIGKQATRLHAIVKDLLDLSHIEQENKRNEILLQELPVLDVLQRAIQACSSKIEENNMAISLNCPQTIQARINPALLEQAVINLLDNAVKYRRANGQKIIVEAEKNDNEVLIRVSDSGTGIASLDIPRIFERFYRVDKARSAKLGGTGLGLSIVKHIVAAHHGQITVESKMGQGSIFTIHLPVKI
jgi:two-component system phosphate regulon sensor histidine kinase PhoR